MFEDQEKHESVILTSSRKYLGMLLLKADLQHNITTYIYILFIVETNTSQGFGLEDRQIVQIELNIKAVAINALKTNKTSL